MSCQINLDSNMYEELNGLSLEQLYSISKYFKCEVIFQPQKEFYIFIDESGRCVYDIGRCLYDNRTTTKTILVNEMYESDWKILVRDQKIKELGI